MVCGDNSLLIIRESSFNMTRGGGGGAPKICIAKMSVTSPIVINMPTRELLACETKSSFV